ncbi:dihydropyrimidinase [candidate division KSB1 bacterium]|nr:dihydropyrimidinase [candidate division KSB1 bacterium]
MDLLIKNGTVVTDAGKQRLDIGVLDGRIDLLQAAIDAPAKRTIDASGRLVFPGFIDAHTHMGIPIMDTHSIDDFESGSIAAACGGVTTIIDFTVQEKGQSLQESVNVRIEKAQGKSHIDYGLHVNVTDQPQKRVSEIPKLIHQGFSIYKVFSTYRQIGMMITWEEFRQVLKTVDDNGGLLCLHAEDNDLIESMTAKNVDAGNVAAIYHPRSRTAEAEAKAISRAAEIAGDLDAQLYIVHLSSRAGLEAALKAREQGVKLYLETCPQYLMLSEEYYEKENGHYWITTPSLRSKEDSEALWQALADDVIDVVATDHCPFTIAQKEEGSKRFHLTPNGLAGVETLFPLLYTYGVVAGRITLEQMVRLLAKNPAEIFGLSSKGSIRLGADADLVIWDSAAENVFHAEKLHGNSDWSAYEGMPISGNLETTILRGQTVVEDGIFVGQKIFGNLLLSSQQSP